MLEFDRTRVQGLRSNVEGAARPCRPASAVSLTGAQIGIRTDSTHTKARIRSISTARMRELLDEGAIVIAAGFQGIDEDFNITTLGRGGSDTTAVALAAALASQPEEVQARYEGFFLEYVATKIREFGN